MKNDVQLDKEILLIMNHICGTNKDYSLFWAATIEFTLTTWRSRTIEHENNGEK